ncbi:unnamed protein product [Darwinula stevensoni]|uniref:Uncharacterized protein n=1 Tax=Darwinula stevensoni TaxID=69355 RepID=A0A7R9AEE8_9CRUS|nr:unnamed protein product [Darwinula stevensoni]CAG0902289.1 unnamed protein product [Darwinula stevensoni]
MTTGKWMQDCLRIVYQGKGHAKIPMLNVLASKARKHASASKNSWMMEAFARCQLEGTACKLKIA